ncbi:MAG: HD domain-containing protein, partial [Elusimicrobia bacterium]|nr:HD domain-containing protein [Elusimicrobiota bacterium]
MNPNLKATLNIAAQLAQKPLYLVGGFLRDFFIGRPSGDMDLAYHGPVRPFAGRLADVLGASLVELDEATKTFRVVPPKPIGPLLHIDIARIQGDGIEADLHKRDFTINAMALALASGSPLRCAENFRIEPERLINPLKGFQDLERKTIRLTSPEALTQDPLRMLRAFRLAAELSFRIERRTIVHIRKHSRLARQPAPERIQTELWKLFERPATAEVLRVMDRAELLVPLIPELEPLRRCAINYYGRGGVLRHTLDVVRCQDFLFENLGRIFPDIAAPLQEHLDALSPPRNGVTARARLKIAGLLHDIAKPATAEIINGRLRFFWHEEKGADMASKILRQLRVSRSDEKLICAVIR